MSDIYNYILIYSYFYGIIIYNIMMMYNDSKKKLIKYKNDKIDAYEKIHIDNEWDAVKYGAYEKFIQNLFSAFIWPLTLFANIIPYIVLKLNS